MLLMLYLFQDANQSWVETEIGQNLFMLVFSLIFSPIYLVMMVTVFWFLRDRSRIMYICVLSSIPLLFGLLVFVTVLLLSGASSAGNVAVFSIAVGYGYVALGFATYGVLLRFGFLQTWKYQG